jgi:hypothetical protein
LNIQMHPFAKSVTHEPSTVMTNRVGFLHTELSASKRDFWSWRRLRKVGTSDVDNDTEIRTRMRGERGTSKVSVPRTRSDCRVDSSPQISETEVTSRPLFRIKRIAL